MVLCIYAGIVLVLMHYTSSAALDVGRQHALFLVN
jgi:hypothetical protein